MFILLFPNLLTFGIVYCIPVICGIDELFALLTFYPVVFLFIFFSSASNFEKTIDLHAV